MNKLIDNEIELAKEGKKGRIILKMNALQDTEMIAHLYEASEAGVEIDLIVRGICCLIPGQNYSRNIRITRIVDSYLEHVKIMNTLEDLFDYQNPATLEDKHKDKKTKDSPTPQKARKRLLKTIALALTGLLGVSELIVSGTW